MDFRSLVDLLLQSGQELAQKGRAMAEQKLELPPEGPEREAMLNSLGKGAAAGGILALLLGTSLGRKITGPALKLGTLAAVGAVAYQALQKWRGQAGGAGSSVDQLSGPAAAARSLALLKAMVAAEIYLTSLLMIDDESKPERAYLDNLAKELKLTPELVVAIESQAKS
ncbi:MAG TPA: DUF533 domain-containing protein [Methylococcaceae bacterium]|nr:DUF533 domain-containing protein [Methylococcaceae bacterium]